MSNIKYLTVAIGLAIGAGNSYAQDSVPPKVDLSALQYDSMISTKKQTDQAVRLSSDWINAS
ncbi:MAG: hypothetical protein KC546_20955, partial [Anaerolineae bacterium]|nr:hypothetical protein [Anaerolineae bacterium]